MAAGTSGNSLARVSSSNRRGHTPDDDVGFGVRFVRGLRLDLFPCAKLIVAPVKTPTVHVHARPIKALMKRPD